MTKRLCYNNFSLFVSPHLGKGVGGCCIPSPSHNTSSHWCHVLSRPRTGGVPPCMGLGYRSPGTEVPPAWTGVSPSPRTGDAVGSIASCSFSQEDSLVKQESPSA